MEQEIFVPHTELERKKRHRACRVPEQHLLLLISQA